ncbi:MAG: hypothetical protein ACAI34_03180, partial [Verrucomicrobium sp.]
NLNLHMEFSWAGACATFQVTFTEFFIASTVFASVVYRSGWRSAVVGSVLGAFCIGLVAAVLGASLRSIPLHLLDWVSSILLLGFGAYLFYEFVTGLRALDNAIPEQEHCVPCIAQKTGLHWPGIGIAAWAVVAEGLEVLVVWLAIALKQGFPSATAGVGIGVSVVLLVALLMGKSGIFLKFSAPMLDGLAAVMVTGYGIYLLSEALRH